MNAVIASICRDAGFIYLQHEMVHGGDINHTYRVQTDKGSYFLKLNHAASFPQMFTKEAEGLKALHHGSTLRVPGVIAVGETATWQWLLLEWLDKGNISKNFWERFGHGLALLHQHAHHTFGWTSDNFIGSLVQSNSYENTWAAFYNNQRIMPLVMRLFDEGLFTKSDIAAAENLANKLSEIFPAEQPALLHGDLWSGNFMIDANGNPCIYDPAVYFGHREMDIGMTMLFGGFDRRFYEAYNESYALEKSWKQRVSLTQLYPLLVHAVLFGGHYVQSCRNILVDS